jgi:(1->4)-alpha-D-glucan 1-alpha-D-glucosylmutase
LADRRPRPLFYAKADYDPIDVSGQVAAGVLCFTRSFGGEKLAVAVPQLPGRSLNPAGLPLGEDAWGDTWLRLPDGLWRNVLDNTEVEIAGGVHLAKLFAVTPFSVLRRAE